MNKCVHAARDMTDFIILDKISRKEFRVCERCVDVFLQHKGFWIQHEPRNSQKRLQHENQRKNCELQAWFKC